MIDGVGEMNEMSVISSVLVVRMLMGRCTQDNVRQTLETLRNAGIKGTALHTTQHSTHNTHSLFRFSQCGCSLATRWRLPRPLQ